MLPSAVTFNKFSGSARFIAGILVTFCLLAVSGCQKDKQKTTAAGNLNADQLPGYQIWDMQVLKTDFGEITSRMQAGYVRGQGTDLNQTEGGDIDSGLTMIFYKKGKTYGRLESKKGRISDDTYIAIDSVRLKSPAGYTLYTQQLTWNKIDKRIHTETPVVTINQQKDTLWGDGFVSSEDMLEYNLINPRGKAFISDDKIKNIQNTDTQ